MTVVTRFAPSPTGRLHLGNIRTALINWLFARRPGGRFLLRLDDTDAERSTEAFADGIRDDLRWLSLEWDAEVRQSERGDRYAETVQKLTMAGRLYACFETAEELERKRKRQLARGKPPIYDRAALALTGSERAKLEEEGRKAHYRFLLERRDVAWTDLVRGEQHVDAGSVSDPVLVRADGTYLYTLPSVVDDIGLRITHVIRGEDHVANTAAQIQLFEALGATPPAFGHHSLFVGAGGEAMSKRLGTGAIESLRRDGIEPMAIASLAATLGTSEPVRPFATMTEIASVFDLGKLSRAPARYDPDELRQLNAKLLHALTYEQVAGRLAALGVGGGAEFWDAVRGNLIVLADANAWWKVVDGDIAPAIEHRDFCRSAAEVLPPEPWDETTWGAWTRCVADATGAKGAKLFRPLRLALTGREHGPELKLLLPLIGRKRVLARLGGRGVD